MCVIDKNGMSERPDKENEGQLCHCMSCMCVKWMKKKDLGWIEMNVGLGHMNIQGTC